MFEGVSFQIHPGQHVGVTGANGTGKSSLFELVLGDLHADAGNLRRPADWVIGHVAQETPPDPRPAVEYVLDGDAELRRIERELAQAEHAGDGHRSAELHGRFEAVGGYRARSRAGRLLSGLGFRPDDEQRAVADFSGGWRVRLNLARALMCRSELLLLDEPTNHLDLDAVIWLEEWLRGYPGTLLLISHDRDFLDAVTTHIAHIEQQRVTLYSGNYTAFERTRAERLANQQAAYVKQQQEIAHIRSYVDRFRAKATKARQAQSRLKALERMAQIAPAHVDSPFHFAFKPPEKAPRPLLALDGAAAGYAGEPIVAGVDMTLVPGDRLGLLGPNGAGKSTLIKVLAGELGLLGGERRGAQDLRVGYFAQHQLEQLHPEHTPLEHLLQLDPAAGEQGLRDYLGGFGFPGDKALEPVGPFSGGEKSRLVLAMLVYQRPNLLLLDEPTNHLDLEMRQALAGALQDFEGAMVVVSHDRHLLRVTCDQLLLVHGGRVEEFAGSLDDYPAWLRSRGRGTTEEAPAAPSQIPDKRKERKRAEAQQRKRVLPFKRAVEQHERGLADLQARKAGLERRLADTTLYEGDRQDELRRLIADNAELDRAIAATEEAWLEATAALEAAQADA
ncbi:MAG: ATP-binding cassette domain-containing protein [Gammaproteobacteria bacterium]